MGPIEAVLRLQAHDWMSQSGRRFYGEEALMGLVSLNAMEALAMLCTTGCTMGELADAWSEAIEAAEALGL